jgi:hypothetical protein
MPAWLVVVLVVLLVSSRPIEARLWRAGRLSDRTTAFLMLGRLPAIALIASVAQGASPLFTVAMVALTTLPAALFYRFFMNLLGEQRAEREREAARAAKV